MTEYIEQQNGNLYFIIKLSHRQIIKLSSFASCISL